MTNRASATIKRLEKEGIQVSQFNFVPKKKRVYTPEIPKTRINCYIPTTDALKLFVRAKNETNGNISKILRKIVHEEVKGVAVSGH